MTQQLSPARAVRGVITVPGDKSISHRYALLCGLAEGESRILNYATGADCASTVRCMKQLGVSYTNGERDGRPELVVEGAGLHGLRPPAESLDVGNSGTTIRMLAGILAGQPFHSELHGDESIARRPMGRIIEPLTQMGARIHAREQQFTPLSIEGGPLGGIHYRMPVASAQVKSCVLLAGLYASGETSVEETVSTRDHTEIALRELGADISIEPRRVHIRPGSQLHARQLVVPGDLSSAAFFLVAAMLLEGSELTVAHVGLNPTRTALLDLLRSMGASIQVLSLEQVNGELIGTLKIRSSKLRGAVVEGAKTAALIDEVPALCVLGTAAQDGIVIRNAKELRVKETDRIETIAQNLTRMGVAIETTPDSICVPGGQRLHAAELDSFGDHRIAMAFSIAALAADGPCTMHNAEAASVSFPEFFATLDSVRN